MEWNRQGCYPYNPNRIPPVMDGFVAPGGKRSYEDFARQVPENLRPILDSVRQFCLSLGPNVVEDVRMHRVVFGKTMTFRWFADVEPESGGILIKVQRSRKEPAQTFRVENSQDVAEFGDIIRQAWEQIT